MSATDWLWMRRALELAERGRGAVEPNPLVGAVVVRDGQVVGSGWHEKYGEAHAEVHALAVAGEAARGATLFVTLEPCCHHGKTPPCTDAVLRAGVGRVVAAMIDPNPRVAGQGIARLQAAGITVDVGAGEAEARRLNAPFVKLVTTGLPHVIAKWAMSLDGKIATRTGDSRWISGEASRRRVHELRGRVDAIVVGSGTVRADDPLLTARPPGPRTPVRVVLDSRAGLPLTSQLVRTAREVPVLVVATDPPTANVAGLEAAGCEVLCLESSNGRPAIQRLLEELGRRRMTNVLVEGGAAVIGSCLDARTVDEVYVFIAPLLIGGTDAHGPTGGRGAEKLAEAVKLAHIRMEAIATDGLFHGWLH